MSDIKKSILHVEDDPDMHAYVQTLLGDIANVTSVLTAKEAKEVLAGNVVDLLLLDLVIKGSSGASMAREFKRFHPDTPIIILSAHDLTDVVEEVDASFIKGKLDVNDFINTIKKMLG